jgi:hypothetical protein
MATPLAALCTTALLTACGGGGSTSIGGGSTTTPPLTPEPGAPASVNNTATDGFNWFNYRRAQLGLLSSRNGRIDTAAQGIRTTSGSTAPSRTSKPKACPALPAWTCLTA